MDNTNQTQMPHQTPQPPVMNTSPAPQKSHAMLMGLGAVILLVLGALGGYLFATSSKSPTSQNTQVAQITPSNTENVPSPTSDQTNSLQLFSSQLCSFDMRLPDGWNSKDATTNPKVDFNSPCVLITAPDYKILGPDTTQGLNINIYRTKIGTTFKSVSINSLSDYITATESILEPKGTATNVTTKTYGPFSGKYFEFATFQNISYFIFTKNNYIYTISWPADYKGDYSKDIESIIPTLQFK